MSNIVEFHKAVMAHFKRGRNKAKKKQAAEQVIHKSRSVIYALGMLLESQRINPVTTTIVRDIDGHKQRITLLEVIRGAEAALNELEQLNG